jgi:hypothetical protein
MDSPAFHVLMRIGLGLASLTCFWVAGYWVRETYRMNKAGKARRFVIPLPTLIEQYMLQDMMKKLQDRQRFRSPFQDGIDRVQFKSTIINNYLVAVLVAGFGFLAAMLVVRDLRG